MKVEGIEFRIEHETFFYTVKFRPVERFKYLVWVKRLSDCETLLQEKTCALAVISETTAKCYLLSALGLEFTGML